MGRGHFSKNRKCLQLVPGESTGFNMFDGLLNKTYVACTQQEMLIDRSQADRAETAHACAKTCNFEPP